MSNAFKCEVTHSLVEGMGVKAVHVQISKDVRLKIIAEHKTARDRFVQGDLSDAGVALIEGAVAKLKDEEVRKAEAAAAKKVEKK